MGALNRAASLCLLLSANGCRCNSVDDRELPAPAIASPSSAAAFNVAECGPDIGGVDAISAAPAVLLGELHGLAAAPAFTGDLACRLAFSDPPKEVLLALEIPDDEQGRIDAFLASEGRTADRTALTAGAFWTSTRDGRSSVARLDMLERIRVLNRRKAGIKVRAVDGTSATGRDETMAKRVVAAVNEKRGPVLVLVGNLHARTQPGGNQKWMGEFIRAEVPGVVSLDNRYGAGEAWICSPACGRQKVSAQDTETDSRWRIDLLSAPGDKGFAGVWRIGPARASDPAVPAPSTP